MSISEVSIFRGPSLTEVRPCQATCSQTDLAEPKYKTRTRSQQSNLFFRYIRSQNSSTKTLAELFFKISLGIPIAWYKARIHGFPRKSIKEGASSLFRRGPERPQMSLALEQPQACTGASLGCTRARDIFGSLRPSPEKTTCSFPYRFSGKSRHSGLVPGNRDPKISQLKFKLRSGVRKLTRSG